MNANLVCWSCGKSTPIWISAAPTFAFEVASWAKNVGWVGVIDTEHSRSLVFCSTDCSDAQRRKDGRFRLRPKAKKEVP